jgi:hypothetical protein
VRFLKHLYRQFIVGDAEHRLIHQNPPENPEPNNPQEELQRLKNIVQGQHKQIERMNEEIFVMRQGAGDTKYRLNKPRLPNIAETPSATREDLLKLRALVEQQRNQMNRLNEEIFVLRNNKDVMAAGNRGILLTNQLVNSPQMPRISGNGQFVYPAFSNSPLLGNPQARAYYERMAAPDASLRRMQSRTRSTARTVTSRYGYRPYAEFSRPPQMDAVRTRYTQEKGLIKQRYTAVGPDNGWEDVQILRTREDVLAEGAQRKAAIDAEIATREQREQKALIGLKELDRRGRNPVTYSQMAAESRLDKKFGSNWREISRMTEPDIRAGLALSYAKMEGKFVRGNYIDNTGKDQQYDLEQKMKKAEQWDSATDPDMIRAREQRNLPIEQTDLYKKASPEAQARSRKMQELGNELADVSSHRQRYEILKQYAAHTEEQYKDLYAKLSDLYKKESGTTSENYRNMLVSLEGGYKNILGQKIPKATDDSREQSDLWLNRSNERIAKLEKLNADIASQAGITLVLFTSVKTSVSAPRKEASPETSRGSASSDYDKYLSIEEKYANIRPAVEQMRKYEEELQLNGYKLSPEERRYRNARLRTMKEQLDKLYAQHKIIAKTQEELKDTGKYRVEVPVTDMNKGIHITIPHELLEARNGKDKEIIYYPQNSGFELRGDAAAMHEAGIRLENVMAGERDGVGREVVRHVRIDFSKSGIYMVEGKIVNVPRDAFKERPVRSENTENDFDDDLSIT